MIRRRLASRPHRIGNEIADRGLVPAHRGDPAVELDRGGAEDTSISLFSSRSKPATAAPSSGLGVTVAGVDHAELRPHATSRWLPCCFELEMEVDDRHVMRVVGRLDG